MNDSKWLVFAWAFVAGVCFVGAVEAGDCHGRTQAPAKRSVAAPTPRVGGGCHGGGYRQAQVIEEQAVEEETRSVLVDPSKIDVKVDITFGEATPAGGVCEDGRCETGAPVSGGGGGDAFAPVSVRDAWKNANRESRAAKRSAVQAAAAYRHAKKADANAKQAAVDAAVRRALGPCD